MATPHTLILDGFLGRPWRWERLRRRIEQTIGPASFFPYDWTGRVDLIELGSRLAEEIAKYPQGVNLIGFSMGGLVIRAAKHVTPGLPIKKAVFLNSPHKGSLLAYLIPTPGVRQMRPRAPILREMAATPWEGETLTVWSGVDGIVIPGISTRFSTGPHVRCALPLHTWPLWSTSIHRRIVEFLADA